MRRETERKKERKKEASVKDRGKVWRTSGEGKKKEGRKKAGDRERGRKTEG